MKVLFIGNSHTYVNDMPQIVKINSDEEMEVVMVARPGITFEDHLNDPTFHFMIKQPFDAVIFQQAAHSPCPSKETTIQDGTAMIEEARENNQHVYVLAPWAHKGLEDKADEIYDIYTSLSALTGVEIIPVGEVIRKLWDQLDLFYKDDEHMSPLGSYVEACCILAKIKNQKQFKAKTIVSGFTSRKFEIGNVDLNMNQLIEETIHSVIQ